MFNIFPPNISLLPVAVRGLSESLNAMKRLKVSIFVCFVHFIAIDKTAKVRLHPLKVHYSSVPHKRNDFFYFRSDPSLIK